MRNVIALLVLSLVAVVSTPVWSYTVVRDSVTLRPVHAQRYHYYYYRGYPMYCDPVSNLWFWLEGGVWRSGYYLPAYLQIYVYDPVSVYYWSPRPYVYFHQTWRRYPPRDYHRWYGRWHGQRLQRHGNSHERQTNHEWRGHDWGAERRQAHPDMHGRSSPDHNWERNRGHQSEHQSHGRQGHSWQGQSLQGRGRQH